MFLLLLVLFISLTSGLYLRNKYEEKKASEIIENDTQEEVIIPEHYANTINNKAKVDQEIIDLICKYNDAYFKSIYSLEFNDVSELFASEVECAVANCANKLLVETRKLYDADYSMSNAYYDLDINEVYTDGNNTYIYLTEDDTFFFNFLDNVESKAYDIEIEFSIVNIAGEYKITSVDKIQDYYVMFTNDNPTSISQVENRYNSLYQEIKAAIENDKNLRLQASNNPYNNNKVISDSYNRDKAKAYMDKYLLKSNDDFYDYSDEGGNCQNYASQCINAGGVDMDYEDEEWYYEEPDDYSSSWTGVKWFYDYIKNNENDGIVGDVDCNLYYGQIGDVIQVGYDDEYKHTTIISNVINGEILVNSNSVDLKDYPINAYAYPLKRLIKILGSN